MWLIYAESVSAFSREFDWQGRPMYKHFPNICVKSVWFNKPTNTNIITRNRVYQRKGRKLDIFIYHDTETNVLHKIPYLQHRGTFDVITIQHDGFIPNQLLYLLP